MVELQRREPLALLLVPGPSDVQFCGIQKHFDAHTVYIYIHIVLICSKICRIDDDIYYNDRKMFIIKNTANMFVILALYPKTDYNKGIFEPQACRVLSLHLHKLNIFKTD